MLARCSRRTLVCLALVVVPLLVTAGLVAQGRVQGDRCLVPRLDPRSDPQRVVRRAGARARPAARGQPGPAGGGIPEPVLRDDLHQRHGQAVRPVGRARRLLPDPRRVGRRGGRPVARPAHPGKGREPDDGADGAGAGQQERGRRSGGRLRRTRARSRLRRKGRQGEDRARQRVGRLACSPSRRSMGPSASSAPAARESSDQAAGATLDQIGWASINVPADREGFGFALSLRQFLSLRDLIDRGQKVVMRAHVRSRTYPGKMNVISAAIPGHRPVGRRTDHGRPRLRDDRDARRQRQLHGRRHTILEVARTLARLIKSGELPPPRRTIRFLWGPEISGSTRVHVRAPGAAGPAAGRDELRHDGREHED